MFLVCDLSHSSGDGGKCEGFSLLSRILNDEHLFSEFAPTDEYRFSSDETFLKWPKGRPTGDTMPPIQGWKFHISAPPEKTRETAEAVLPILVKHGFAHKVVANQSEFDMYFSKGESQQGKFITVYPRDIDKMKKAITEIEAAVNKIEGTPLKIENEQKVGESGYITARYGTFTAYGEQNKSKIFKLDADGYLLSANDSNLRLIKNGKEIHISDLTNRYDDYIADNALFVDDPKKEQAKPSWIELPDFFENNI